MKLIIYTDGASRGNPGISASGFNIYDENYTQIGKGIFYNGKNTNNFAEYRALIEAIKYVIKNYGIGHYLLIYSDSELLVNQIKGRYKVKDKKIKELHSELLSLLKNFVYEIKHLKREDPFISKVDKELNKFLDKKEKELKGLLS